MKFPSEYIEPLNESLVPNSLQIVSVKVIEEWDNLSENRYQLTYRCKEGFRYKIESQGKYLINYPQELADFIVFNYRSLKEKESSNE